MIPANYIPLTRPGVMGGYRYDDSGVDGDTHRFMASPEKQAMAKLGAAKYGRRGFTNPPASGDHAPLTRRGDLTATSPFDSGLSSTIASTPTMRQAWHDYRKAVPLYVEVLTAPAALALLPVATVCRAEKKVKRWIA